MKTFETLYARNSNGKINQWIVEASDTGIVTINEGLLDGILTSTNRQSKAKNLGKMNETSAYEQALKDSQSRWELKKKKGYKSLEDLNIEIDSSRNLSYYDISKMSNNLLNEVVAFKIKNTNGWGNLIGCLEVSLPKNRTDSNNLTKPMKAQPYFKDDGSVRINFPCYGQPKLNGFRVMARWEKVMEGEGIFRQEVEKVVFRSKEGLRYDILEHIEDEFTKEMFSSLIKSPLQGLQDIAFDGEMYIEGEILSEISSAVRKRNSKTPLLKFYIFDLAIENMNQDDRLSNCCLKCSSTIFNNIKYVNSDIIDSNEEAQLFTDICIKKGYEGAIFRDMKATYQFGKRPQTMTKLKRSQDKEFIIKDVVNGENAPELGIFLCIAENGKEFKVNPEGNHEVKKEYLSNKNNYIGKKLTVKFFERTKDDIPFHAIGVAIRDYE